MCTEFICLNNLATFVTKNRKLFNMMGFKFPLCMKGKLYWNVTVAGVRDNFSDQVSKITIFDHHQHLDDLDCVMMATELSNMKTWQLTWFTYKVFCFFFNITVHRFVWAQQGVSGFMFAPNTCSYVVNISEFCVNILYTFLTSLTSRIWVWIKKPKLKTSNLKNSVIGSFIVKFSPQWS